MRVTYLEGDPCSPKYVAGALRRMGWEVEQPRPGDALHLDGASVVIVSDVPADQLGVQAGEIARSGAGVLLVGGWFSFGRGGWAGTELARIAPVRMHAGDDRVRRPGGIRLRRAGAHPITEDLPWDEPVVVVGHNRVEADGEVLIDAEGVPILVCREMIDRVAAFTSDLAPHWSGGLTDWGTPALDVDVREQVGFGYARLLDHLCRWLGSRA